ncbi:MAG: helix-turn-helix domain-containing protein [Planctomycetota bacterium]|nr:helix-turn-helix domain-containing protein [Planctomycetota bacterium]
MATHNRVVKGTGNVFADLGYADAEEHQTKARLASRIAKQIKKRNLTQAEAAKALGIDQPKVSAMLRGRFRGFSVYRLMRFVADLGCKVEIVAKEGGKRSRKIVDEIPVHAGTD